MSAHECNLAWEYPLSMCYGLCTKVHGQIHRKIQETKPLSGERVFTHCVWEQTLSVRGGGKVIGQGVSKLGICLLIVQEHSYLFLTLFLTSATPFQNIFLHLSLPLHLFLSLMCAFSLLSFCNKIGCLPTSPCPAPKKMFTSGWRFYWSCVLVLRATNM